MLLATNAQNFKKLSAADVFSTFSLQNLLFATTACNFSTSELLKCSRTLFFFFEHFDFKMRFAPQQRAIFRCQNFKKCSRTLNFFWDILTSKRASLQKVLPDLECFLHVLTSKCASRHSGVRHLNLKKCSRALTYLSSKCASGHSGVQFFDIRTSKSALNLICFVHFHFKICFSLQRRAIFDFSCDHMTPHAGLCFNRPTFRLTRHTNH